MGCAHTLNRQHKGQLRILVSLNGFRLAYKLAGVVGEKNMTTKDNRLVCGDTDSEKIG